MIIEHSTLTTQQLRLLLRQGKIRLAGNRRLKIYGLLRCASGKRMAMRNRVFFTTVQEALALGYRPCGHCLRADYRRWREGNHGD